MALHVSGEAPEEQLSTDFSNLNKFNDEAFTQIFGLVFGFLMDPQQSVQFLSQLEEIASKHSLGLNALKNLVKSVLVFKAALKQNLSPNYIKEDMLLLGLSEENSTLVATQWRGGVGSMVRAAAGQTLTVNQLVDMEWRFGVTAADSDMKKVGNNFLQLKLVLNKGGKTEDVFMELTLNQFYSFLHEMEKVKSSLDYFS
ncbi:hypothetical protein EMCRGX_G002555 [Ephydatia muelleri]